MPVSSQTQPSYTTLLREAGNAAVPDKLRIIALGQIVEELQNPLSRLLHKVDCAVAPASDSEPKANNVAPKVAPVIDTATAHRTKLIRHESELALAQKVAWLISELPETRETGDLLNAAVQQITRRLPPNQGAVRIAAPLELQAAETAALMANRTGVNAQDALTPLLHIIETLNPNPTIEGLNRYADAAALLIANCPGDESIQSKAVSATLKLLSHNAFPLEQRMHRIGEIFINAPDLSDTSRKDFQSAFTLVVEAANAIDPKTAVRYLDDQTTRFEIADRPDLVADVVIEAYATLFNKARKANSPEKEDLSAIDILGSILERMDNMPAPMLAANLGLG